MKTQNPESRPTRVFKIGTVRIVEDESMRDKTVQEIQKMLVVLYPQIAHSTPQKRVEGDLMMITYKLPIGRKG